MGKRVLLVDNSVPLSQSVKFTLSREGYEVALVEDEEVAINKLSTEIYDVVILDLKNANQYGSTMLRFLQNRKGEIPVLALMNFDWGNSMEEHGLPGVTDWIVVPFSNEKLTTTIRKICS